MHLWIVNPSLWKTCTDKAKKDIPENASIFWERVKQLYERYGGKFIVPDLGIGGEDPWTWSEER